MNTEKGFLLFYDWMPAFESLTPKDFKTLIVALCNYQRDGTPPPEFSNKVKAIAAFVFPQIDRRKYLSAMGKKGAVARRSAPILPLTGTRAASSHPESPASTPLHSLPSAKDRDQDQEETKTEAETESVSAEAVERSVSGGEADARAESGQDTALEERGGGEQIGQGYGRHKNVYLSTEEYLALRREIGNADAYIDRFSEKLYSKGYRYPDHFRAIREWWERDRKLGGGAFPTSDPQKGDGGSFDTDEFFAAAVKRSLGEGDLSLNGV
jgi:hypothetical protein